ncbi:hypothetical protein [Roseobacter sp. EG26]|uniref:hypothetical protein n=1 Tax=Roseobacter sp. EG26 TaxID=3412477 RepID=UPI003CE5591B
MASTTDDAVLLAYEEKLTFMLDEQARSRDQLKNQTVLIGCFEEKLEPTRTFSQALG